MFSFGQLAAAVLVFCGLADRALAVRSKLSPLEKMTKQVGRNIETTKDEIKELKLFAQEAFKGLSDMHVSYTIPIVEEKGRLRFGFVMNWAKTLQFDAYPSEWNEANYIFSNPRLRPEIFIAANRDFGVTMDSIKEAITKTSNEYKVAQQTVKTMTGFARMLKTNKPALTMPLSLFDGLIQYNHGMVDYNAMRAVADKKYGGEFMWPVDIMKDLGITPVDFMEEAQKALSVYLPGRRAGKIEVGQLAK